MTNMMLLQMMQTLQTMQQSQMAIVNKLQSPGTARERRRATPTPVHMMAQLQEHMDTQKRSAQGLSPPSNIASRLGNLDLPRANQSMTQPIEEEASEEPL